ncbi:MAG: TetR/AcrR family transcriptional regulator [Pseudomonadales bacterium]
MQSIANTDQRRARSERTREKLLDAAMLCYKDRGINNTAMDNVAQQAGVGRATLYRHFNNQEALLTEVMTRNVQELQHILKSALSNCETPEDYYVEATLVIIRECRQRSLIGLLFGDDSSTSVISRISFSDKNILAMGTDLISPFYKRAKAEGVLRQWVTKPLLQEWTSRLLLSFLTNPSPHLSSEKEMRQFLYQAVIPSIIDRPAA